ncbi:MAG: HEAT repeat domain-containing protein [Moorea sp. SIO2B7]|nr:HEAT repeat domain-containing protein [Moorena sp. SIO2B7]
MVQYTDNTQTLKLLCDRAENAPDEKVRESAIKELAQNWQDNPETLPFLKNRAQSDQSAKVISRKGCTRIHNGRVSLAPA